VIGRLLAGLVPALFACALSAAQLPGVVRIGFASPLTGPQAHYGRDNRNGAQMAIDELNERRAAIGARFVRFELASEDDQADPKTGTLVAQRLVDMGIKGMVGHFNSGVTIPASRIYHDSSRARCALRSCCGSSLARAELRFLTGPAA
jgi:branched-chain amino acid transport system substrate-binding protein